MFTRKVVAVITPMVFYLPALCFCQASDLVRQEWENEQKAMRELGGPALFRVERRGEDKSTPSTDGNGRYYDRVVFANLNPILAKDEELRVLKAFKYIEKLDLTNTSVTNAGLSHLKDTPKIEWLTLAGTEVTDDGIAHLASLPHLKTLYMRGLKITDVGLSHLSNLHELESLDIRGVRRITDSGLKHLQHSRTLKRLFLDGTRVTDAGLEYLRELDNLKVLTLENTDVSEAGIRQLKCLQTLESLTLPDQVNETQLASLKRDHPTIRIKSSLLPVSVSAMTKEGRFTGGIEINNNTDRDFQDVEFRDESRAVLARVGVLKSGSVMIYFVEGLLLPEKGMVHWKTSDGRSIDVKAQIWEALPTAFKGDLAIEIMSNDEVKVSVKPQKK